MVKYTFLHSTLEKLHSIFLFLTSRIGFALDPSSLCQAWWEYSWDQGLVEFFAKGQVHQAYWQNARYQGLVEFFTKGQVHQACW